MVDEFVLSNGRGLTAKFIPFGATLTSLQIADKAGKPIDVVLGFDDLHSYQEKSPYFGAVVGRVANRIANARFELNGQSYNLSANEKPNSLHGGKRGFDKVMWQAEPFPSGVRFRYRSADGDEGYPGNLDVTVQYSIDDSDSLTIDYRATTDRETPINLTQHSYFNLAGHDSGNILDHELWIDAPQYVVVDDALIPTGELKSVRGTPYDFNKLTKIGERLDKLSEKPPGYDHCYVLNPKREEGTPLRARLRSPHTGLEMHVLSSEPGLQFYSGNRIEGLIGKAGAVYKRYQGLCLECQHFPDSVHHPNFPNTILQPGEVYTQKTIYRFVQN
ncbi:MAG: aldose epimerase family protein [Gemmataceae bacterium]